MAATDRLVESKGGGRVVPARRGLLKTAPSEFGPFARTYGIVAVVVVLQMFLVLIAPSTALHGSGRAGHLVAGGVGADSLAASGAPTDTAHAQDASASGAATAGGKGASAARGGNAASGVAGGPAAASGDVSHCVAGREFDPAIDYFAPACTPGSPGKPYPNNGGATSAGVTADRIEIVDFIPYLPPGVDAVAKAEGIADSYDDAATMDGAFQNFINAKYVMFGRKVHVDTYKAQCTIAPPEPTCMNSEIDQVVETYHPYAMLFRTACSWCHAELARLKVVSFGGMAFSDAFHNALAPYNYDTHISGTRAALSFAQWWCSQMTSRTGGRTVEFAGTQNPSQNFNGRPRVLGVIASRDQDLEDTVRHVLYPALERGCGEKVTHEYFYESRLDNAAQQMDTATAAMNTSSNPATTVVCLCVTVGADVFYNGMQQRNYWPESIFASNQWMDWETSAQNFAGANGQPTLGCPSPATGCEFDGAVGLSELGSPERQDNTTGLRVFRLGGGTANVSALSLDDAWSQYEMMASLIENTGPVLTPARMQAAAPLMGFRGGGTTGHPLRGFRPGEWTWNHDFRVVYYNKRRPSPYNGIPGTLVEVEGRRFDLGEYPVLPQPPVPAVGQRT